MDYSQHHRTRQQAPVATPQTQPIPGRTDQVPNSAGGYVFEASAWTQLERFLVLGTQGGSYYATERDLTKANVTAVQACLAEDGPRVVATVVAVSDGGRAISNDPALFVLAMAASAEAVGTRKAAFAALPKVARTGTHLFHFMQFATALRGTGPGLRRAVSRWYNDRPAESLAHQLLKYKQRDGWSQADVLKLAHPAPATPDHDFLYRYSTVGWDDQERRNRRTGEVTVLPGAARLEGVSPQVRGYVETVHGLTKDTSLPEVLRAITDYKLTHEMLPTEHKANAAVWDALLPHMPLMATIRNLGNMTRYGLLTPYSEATQAVLAKLGDQAALVRQRVHPLSILVALRTYAGGRGHASPREYTAVPKIVGALDAAFYLAFKAVEPTHKRIQYCLDVSGSMSASAGGKPVTCAEAATALSLVLANVESRWDIMAFNDGIQSLNVNPRWSLEEALRKTSNINYGGTDCALPMRHAAERGLDVDAFVVFTDSETWAGSQHASQALVQYRRQRGIPDAKLAVVAMVANPYTIADPTDPNMIDYTGFDTSLPQFLSEFIGYAPAP